MEQVHWHMALLGRQFGIKYRIYHEPCFRVVLVLVSYKRRSSRMRKLAE